MDKEKEIQEMANIFCTVDDEVYVACAECAYYDEENDTIKSCPNYSKGKALKELLYNAGYRKADDMFNGIIDYIRGQSLVDKEVKSDNKDSALMWDIAILWVIEKIKDVAKLEYDIEVKDND